MQRGKSYFGFCFTFNVGSTLFQRWSTTLRKCWSDVEMLAGYVEAPFSKGWRPTHFNFMKKKPTSRCFPRTPPSDCFTGHLRVTASEAGVTWIFLLLLKPIVYSCFLISKPHKYYIYFIWFKRSCILSTKLNEHLYGMVKTCGVVSFLQII